MAFYCRCMFIEKVAARNVLLDAAMTCKVSDFGMSTALAGDKDNSDYAANYVKVRTGSCFVFVCLFVSFMPRTEVTACMIASVPQHTRPTSLVDTHLLRPSYGGGGGGHPLHDCRCKENFQSGGRRLKCSPTQSIPRRLTCGRLVSSFTKS